MAVARILAVIDGTNLKGCLNRYELTTRVNYRRLVSEVAKQIPKSFAPDRWVVERVVYVTAPPIQSHDRERYERWRDFEAMIRRTDKLELKLGRMEGPRDRVYEKGVDILVAIELLVGAFRGTYEIAILVAGDGDYADVARVVRAEGKPFFNAFFEYDRSHELVKASTGFLPLDDLVWKRLELYRPKPGEPLGRA